MRKLAHLLVLALGWIGFVWMWLLVAARPWDSRVLVRLILGSLLLVPLLTGAWVLHNRSLHRRKGERRSVARADMSYAQDWHGRQVQADWSALHHSRVVLISVEGGRKLYRGGSSGNTPAAMQPLPSRAAAAPARAVAPHAPLR
ncbi:MAG TPA: hypothetical protein PKB14_02200 [Rubrivivax sp.]|nr:hypothetical protein [Rubrivivax sp.]